MKKTIVIVMAIVAMLLTCNMASAANVAIYTSTGSSAESILSVFRAVKAMGHEVYGIDTFDLKHDRLNTDDFDVLILPPGEYDFALEGSTAGRYYYTLGCPLCGALDDKIEAFVSDGGGFVGIQAGAYYATNSPWSGYLGIYDGSFTEDYSANGPVTINISDSLFNNGGAHTTQLAYMSAGLGDFTWDTTKGQVKVATESISGQEVIVRGDHGSGRVILTSLELSLRGDSLDDWTMWDNYEFEDANETHDNSVGAWKLLARMIDWAEDGTVDYPNPTIAQPSPTAANVAVICGYVSNPFALDYGGAWSGLIPAVGRSIENAGHTPLAIRFSDVASKLTIDNFDVVVFPGGNANGYVQRLSGDETVIQNFVSAGGGYLGLCAGSFYGANEIQWNGETLPGPYDYPLDLYDVSGQILRDTGPIDSIARYDQDSDYEWAATQIDIVDPVFVGTGGRQMYYGGGYKNTPTDVTTVATYNAYSNEPDAVRFTRGDGRVLLVGTHPEATSDMQDWLYWNNYYWNSPDELIPEHSYNGWTFVDAVFNNWLLEPNKEIKLGLRWLRNHQEDNGSWYNNVGYTALATLALLNAGYTETDDEDVYNGIQYLLNNYNTYGDGGIYNWYGNYDTSIAILALKATNNTNYNDEILAAANYLINIQSDDFSCPCYGGWGYWEDHKNIRSDLSNSQFTAMALDTAEYVGATVPSAVWTNFETFLSRVQNLDAINDMTWANDRNDGGFNYDPAYLDIWGLDHNSYGSMTAAGIWSLRLIKDNLGNNIEVADSRVQAALGWLGLNEDLSFNINPIPVPDPLPVPGPYDGYNTNRYYYYMSFAKAMAMCFLDQADAGQWYSGWQDALESKIISEQGADGSWDQDNQGQMVDTLWALLTLQTQQPLPTELWASIILASPADLLVYDPQGRVCSKDECNIPGAEFKTVGDQQIVNLHEVEPGHYRFVFIGTGDGPVHLTVKKYRDDDIINTIEKDFSILPGVVLESDVLVSSLIGALTIMVEEPEKEKIPPDISVSVSPDTLWPPNHKMVLITPTITVNDNYDPNPSYALTSITMNEGEETDTYDPNYDSTQGDGHTTNDIQVDENGNIYLRAERAGKGSGRIYTIIYTATDGSGNSATAFATVNVPHNQ